jgi:hypothetical protein
MTKAQLQKAKRIAKEVRLFSLGKKPSRGACFALSLRVSAALAEAGIPTTLDTTYVGDSSGRTDHWFLRLEDGQIVDATADQFGGPKVYVGAMPAHYQ